MFTFYASEDKGLLNEKIKIFKDKNQDYVHIKNCEIVDLENSLLQISIFGDKTNYLIENYVDKQSSLIALLKKINLNDINLFITYNCEKKEKILIGLTKLINNNDYNITKLNKRTKNSYTSDLCKSLNLHLTSNQQELLYCKLPKSAEKINEIVENLSLYSDGNKNEIDEAVINYFLETVENESTFFDFFAHFFLLRKNEWILIFNQKINNCTDLVLFLKAFTYKLTEFLNFLNMRKKITMKEILQETNKPLFWFMDFEDIYQKHFCKINKYTNEFTINFYFLVNENIEILFKNIALLKHFFLVNSIDLYVE